MQSEERRPRPLRRTPTRILDRKFATPNEWAEHYATEFDRWLALESQHHKFRPFTMTVAFVCAMLQRAIDREHTQ